MTKKSQYTTTTLHGITI